MTPLAGRLLLLAGGLFVCFRGYSAFRFALGVTAFLVGAYAAASRQALFPQEPPWLAPAAVLVAGLVALLLVVVAYRVGVFLLGASACVLIALEFPNVLPTDPNRRLLVLAAAALVGGLLSRFVERLVLSAATALVGGLMAVSAVFGESVRGLPAVRAVRDLPQDGLFVGAWALLFVFGLWAQLGGGKSGRSRHPAEVTTR